MVPGALLGDRVFYEVVYFLLSDFFSEFLVLLLGDSLVIYTIQELFYVLEVVIAGVVLVQFLVEVCDGSLGSQLSFVLDLCDRAIVVLSLSDDLSDGILSWRWTRKLVLDFCGLELSLITYNFDFI